MPTQRVGLIANSSKWEALSFAQEVLAWLSDRGLDARLDADSAKVIGRDDISADSAALAECDLLITLGGDGTILAAAQIAGPAGVPILGVHMGHFGFIAEAHPSELPTALDTVLEGRVDIRERLMVACEVDRGGEVVHTAMGLNDIVINKGALARVLSLRTTIDSQEMVVYPADGVIIATPTGSTGYSLSAGGPLVEPTVRALIIAPICPHTLAARPMLVPADASISVHIESDGGEAILSADSTQLFRILQGDTVRVNRAAYTAKLVSLHAGSFYRKVRRRLVWGERINA